MKEDLTILFSGYNILDEMSKAVSSFLYFHPQYKENIVIFDDNSTDGTYKYFSKEGFKILQFNDNLRAAPQYKKSEIMGYHVSEIMQQAISKIDTKWLFNFHGDMIFKKEFMSEFENSNIDEYDIYCPFGGAEMTDRLDDIPEFNILYSEKHKCYIRYWEVFMLLNLHKLKELGIKYDHYESEELLLKTLRHTTCIIDTGAKLMLDCINRGNEIRVFNFSHRQVEKIIDHNVGTSTGSCKKRIQDEMGIDFYE